MAKEKKTLITKEETKEPIFIIRPALKNFGLDYLHIALLILVVILVGLALSLATFKQGVIIKNCTYGIVNGTCVKPQYNSPQALEAAEKVLASYVTINTSLSLLPYYTLVNQSKVSYLSDQDQWLVVIPYTNPLVNGEIDNVSILLHGSNLTLVNPFIQTIKPPIIRNDTIAAYGSINIYGRTLCTTSRPIPVYLIIDPYAPGSIDSLSTAINASKNYGNSINMSYYIIFTAPAARFYPGYGVDTTQSIGRYLSCTSKQQRFPAFLANLTHIYSGLPLTNLTLYQTAYGSGINTSMLNACMQNVTTSLNFQAALANLYNVVSTPEFISDCKYASIPQTLGYSINYTLKTIK